MNIGAAFEQKQQERPKDCLFAGNDLGLRLKELFPKIIFIAIFGFLMGRVEFLNGIMPFGTAFFVVIYINKEHYKKADIFLAAASCLTGTATTGKFEQLLLSAVCICFYLIICNISANLIFDSKEAKKEHSLYNNCFVQSLTAFISLAIPSCIFAVINGGYLFDFIKGFVYSLTCALMIFILPRAWEVLNGLRTSRTVYGEDAISIAIFISIALVGIGEANVFGFGIKNILSIFIILLFSYKCGPSAGAATGAAIGFISGISSVFTPVIIGTYALCGLLSGLLRTFGKAGCGLGFVVGNAVLTIYLEPSSEAMIYIKEITAALIIFILLPSKVLDSMASVFESLQSQSLGSGNEDRRMKNIVIDRLMSFSKSFEELSKTFEQMASTDMIADKQEIAWMFDRVVERVCKDCSLCRHCWEKDFYLAYQVMLKIMEDLDQKGYISIQDIPPKFIQRCERIYEFINGVNNVYEIFKLNVIWKNRISENKEIVSEQLKGLSVTIEKLARSINQDYNFRGDIEFAIKSKLKSSGMHVQDCIVIEDNQTGFDITIVLENFKDFREYSSQIEKLVSAIANKKMMLDISRSYSQGAFSIIKLMQEPAMRVITGVARRSKSNSVVSGDNYTFFVAANGKYVAAISDGMGTGGRASSQSSTAISLLEQFMEAGFDKNTAIKLINSALVMKSQDEYLSTIDMSVINLYTGETEFLKIGAAPTFIKRSGSVDVIKSANLPAGVFSSIEAEYSVKKVSSGDFIIMVSDGVSDAFAFSVEAPGLAGFISEIETLNPQVMAEKILEEAQKRLTDNDDDMLVLVCKIWNK